MTTGYFSFFIKKTLKQGGVILFLVIIAFLLAQNALFLMLTLKKIGLKCFCIIK